MEIGLVLNFNESLSSNFSWCAEHDIHTCQLSIQPDLLTPKTADKIRLLCEKHAMRVTALVGAWSGPNEWNFQHGPTTLGIVPAAYRAVRMRELEDCARFANSINVADICTHIGFIPENPSDALYSEVVSAVAYLAGYYKESGLRLNMETGQETPITLLRLIHDVGADNLGINFDPANLLMYGKANPIDALFMLGRYVNGAHAKDGEYPTDGFSLGEEKPLGQGSVNIKKYIETLVKIGYTGAVTIEREISGDRQKEDILAANQLLREIVYGSK